MKTVTLNALDAYLNSVKNSINCNAIDEILNLPAKFRWFAAKRLLTTDEFNVAVNAGVRRTEPKKFRKLFAEIAEKAIKELAYQVSDFGRYQSVHRGISVLPSRVQVRYEMAERYSRKFTSTDLYSDYFFSVADTSNLEFLIKTPADENVRKVSFFDLGINHYENGVKFDFIYNHPLFKRAGFSFDKKEVAVKWKDDLYHIEDYQAFSSLHNNTLMINVIVRSFQNRKRLKKQSDKFNSLPLDKIFVEKSDSIQSGNCPLGTDNFIKSTQIGRDFALRADVLLRMRNDEYTKRAVFQAYKNGHYIHS